MQRERVRTQIAVRCCEDPCPSLGQYDCHHGQQMDLTGTYTFTASAERSGRCSTIRKSSPRACRAAIAWSRSATIGSRPISPLAVASISGQYTGTVAIVDKQRTTAYRLIVEGSGKAGFVKGEARVELADGAGTTTVNVKGQGQVGGLMARVGQRLLGSVSQMMMDRFFAFCGLKRRANAHARSAPTHHAVTITGGSFRLSRPGASHLRTDGCDSSQHKEVFPRVQWSGAVRQVYRSVLF